MAYMLIVEPSNGSSCCYYAPSFFAILFNLFKDFGAIKYSGTREFMQNPSGGIGHRCLRIGCFAN